MSSDNLIRAVANISSCRVYVISRRGIVQQGRTFGSIFFLLPIRGAGVHSHLSDSPGKFLILF